MSVLTNPLKLPWNFQPLIMKMDGVTIHLKMQAHAAAQILGE
jgi:hypothetical protein